ncbi:MAG: diaminopimelate decarboxylase, partial [Dehalococcoidia bacterium]|nr:diaminopimelate decarboxylase [Dehalococcoidia bacterium]
MLGLSLFPPTTQIDRKNHLIIGGCDAVALASEFGTPLYVFDEATLRGKCAVYREEFGRRYPDSLVIYACKAFINRALAQIFKEEGFGLDVVSGGELSIAISVGFPMEKVYFHGNNKSREELELAIHCGVGRVVADNFHELSLLKKLAKEAGINQGILLRLSPGVDPHTHAYVSTGDSDSKFGFPMTQAEEAIAQSMSCRNLELNGLHFHIGSQIFELESYRKAIAVLLQFAAEMKTKYEFKLNELNVGGGLAIAYSEDSPTPTIAELAQIITSSIIQEAKVLGVEPPRLILEPGRSIVGQAGVALYTAGAIKEIAGVRKYVSIDGGMADNIRPALYQAEYEAVVADKMEGDSERVTIAGKFCESGDILITDIDLPKLEPGDIIAVPCCGAYCLS